MFGTGTHWLRYLLLCALAICAPAPLYAQTITPTTIKFAGDRPVDPPQEPGNAPLLALPDWPDQLPADRFPSRAAPTAAISPQPAPTATCEPQSPPLSADRKIERPTYAITQASAEMPVPTTLATSSPQTAASLDGLPPARDPRRLGSPKQSGSFQEAASDQASIPRRFIPDFGLPLDAMYTTGVALAVVVGLFLLCAWALRRGARKSVHLLSNDVAQVLGRVPLAARQFAELLHVGNKLVLVSVTSAGAETLTEITDPLEVDRLLGICKQADGRSSTAEFDEMFRQLTEEPTPSGFLGEETIRLDARSAAGAYAAQRGGARRG
jgi:flagellar biogenesis protein FliO